MTTAVTSPPASRSASISEDLRSPRIYRRIAALARRSPSKASYYRDLIDSIAEGTNALFAGIHVRLPTEVVDRTWNDGSVHPDFWREAVRGFLTESLAEGGLRARLFRSRDGSTQVSILSAPLQDAAGAFVGAVAVMVHCSEEELDGYLTVLHSLTVFGSQCSCFLDAPPPSTAPSLDPGAGKTVQSAAAYESREELAFAITNQLQNKSGCEQVALGEVRGKHVRILTISGLDEVKVRSPGVIRLRQAMEECLDRGKRIVYQPRSDWATEESGPDYRLHRQWHEDAGGDSVASLPLGAEGSCDFVLSLRRSKTNPFSAEEVDKYTELVEPYIPAMQLVERATRGVFPHMLASLRTARGRLLQRGGWSSKAFFALLVAFAGWFIFGSTDYEVSVPCTVAPAEVRGFGAPADGILRRAQVVPGDRVLKGEVLCEFDDRELRLERERLVAELNTAALDESKALSEGDRVGARLARVKEDELRSLLDIVKLKIEQSVIRAPFDGEIVNGDLRERVGDLLLKGEPLFELSADRGWLIELRIPEAEIAGFVVGLEGRFATHARPEEGRSIRITRVAPSSKQHDGRTVYVAEAQADEQPEWIRSGMEGVARVEIGRRSVCWVSFHSLINWARLNLWL